MRNAIAVAVFATVALLAGAGCATHSTSAPALPGAPSGTQNSGRHTMSDPPPTVVYNSIPSPLFGIASQGFECCSLNEFGDGLNLTATGTLGTVSFVMDSWGCQRGDGNEPSTGTNPCVTTPGPPSLPTFDIPITLNVYAVNGSATRVGAKLLSITQTFSIPYRPSADARCDIADSYDGGTADPGAFVLASDGLCRHGYPNTITFTGLPATIVPSQTIFSLAYNTTTKGYFPTGVSCNNTLVSGSTYPADSCGYDSLNIGINGNGGPIGSVLDRNGVFDYWTYAPNLCNPETGGAAVGVFGLDSGPSPSPGCWSGFHPLIQVTLSSVTCYAVTDSTGQPYTAARLGGGNNISVSQSPTAPCDIGIYIGPNNGPASLDHTVVSGPFGIGVYVDNVSNMHQDHTQICVNGANASGGCNSGTGTSPGTGQWVRNSAISLDHTSIDAYAVGFATQPCPNTGYPITADHTMITPARNPNAWAIGPVGSNKFNFLVGHDSPTVTGNCNGSATGAGGL